MKTKKTPALGTNAKQFKRWMRSSVQLHFLRPDNWSPPSMPTAEVLQAVDALSRRALGRVQPAKTPWNAGLRDLINGLREHWDEQQRHLGQPFEMRFKAALRKAQRRALVLQSEIDRKQAELNRLKALYPITLPPRKPKCADLYDDYPG